MAHDTDEGAARAWYEKGLAEGRKQAAYEQGLAAGRSGQQPEATAPPSSPGYVATMSALAQAGVPVGHQGTSSLTTAAGAAPAPAAVGASEVIDWDAIAAKSNTKDGLRRNEVTGIWGRK
ncbi:hypothetical protein MKK75_03795 [Methylobacterium sp. J-030]|uniref:hypothetical protein n=1 Tax=Methylobacterium sp. J-030 TaxID=2836627 RepID=UPI001FB9E74B|nr:hypothetical protein [Methylobacterium sp. J-030]MCJ2067938.1 hypothetical protein [Methylobacterium sp. J-030]